MKKFKFFTIFLLTLVLSSCFSKKSPKLLKINVKIHSKMSADFMIYTLDENGKDISKKKITAQSPGLNLIIDEKNNTGYIYNTALIKFVLGEQPKIIEDKLVEQIRIKNGKVNYFTNEGFSEKNKYKSTFYGNDKEITFETDGHVKNFIVKNDGNVMFYELEYLTEKNVNKHLKEWDKKTGKSKVLDTEKNTADTDYIFLKETPFKYKFDEKNNALIRDVLNNKDYEVVIEDVGLNLTDFSITVYEHQGKIYLSLLNLYDREGNAKKEGIYTYEIKNDEFVLTPLILEPTSKNITFYKDTVSFNGKIYDLKTKKVIKNEKEERILSLIKLD